MGIMNYENYKPTREASQIQTLARRLVPNGLGALAK